MSQKASKKQVQSPVKPQFFVVNPVRNEIEWQFDNEIGVPIEKQLPLGFRKNGALLNPN